MSVDHGGSNSGQERSAQDPDGGPTPRQDPGGEQALRQREVQIGELVQAFAEQGVPIGIGWDDGEPGRADFLYVKDVLLTLDEDAERVRQVLRRGGYLGDGDPADNPPDKDDGRDQPRSRVDGRPRARALSGLTRIVLDANPDALEALELVDRALGPGVATPDHVVHISGQGSGCPATEPVPSDGPLDPPPAYDSELGRGVRVSVVDSGLIPDLATRTGWLAGVTGDDEQPTVGRYRGHGTFIAGIVRATAPSAEVDVEAFLYIGGGLLESDLAPALGRALETMPDVISMSAGARTRHGHPLKSLEVFWEKRLRHVKGTVLVCAAGNDGDRGPFWPAAFPWTVSVGALESDGSRARYSNHGSWVDVWARGSDVVNAYPEGVYTYAWPPLAPGTVSFKGGLASWCGTSFSTPLVSGLIAARMSWSGESAREAATALLAESRGNATPFVGAVLEPGMADQPPPGP